MKKHPLSQAIVLALSISAANGSFAAGEIEEVIVTGQKTQRSLQDTVDSVAVVTDLMMEEQGIRDFYEVMERTANIHAQPGIGFNIRGIDAFNVSGGGNSYLTSVYIDNAVMPYRVIQQGAFSTWDLQQVEVLRGPQSTLQGRNALAGAIMMNSKSPQHEWDANFRLGTGQDGRRETAFAGGGSLIEDQLAFRIAAESKKIDGVNYNVTRQESSDFFDSKNLRAKLLWEPSSLPEFSALLSYSYTEADEGPRWVNEVPGDRTIAPYKNRIVNFNDPITEFTETKIYTLELNYELNENWDIKSISTYSDAYYGYDWDGDSGPQPGSTLDDNRDDKTFSQEFRFSFDYDNFTGLIGAYYSDLDVRDIVTGTQNISFQALGVRPTLVGMLTQQGVPGAEQVADLVLAQYANADPVELGRNADLVQKVSSTALFFDGVYKINDQWEVFAGIRWDREEQENSSITDITIANQDQLPNPANYSFNPQLAGIITVLNGFLHQQAANASGTQPLVDASFNEILPKAGITYHWNDDISTSFTYQKGYRSGGVGSNIAKATTFQYDPEFTDNYELSFRSQWLDKRLTVNANLFYLDWKDQQVLIQYSSNRYDRGTENAGRSEVKGFEVESNFIVNDEWSIYGSLGLSDTEFKTFFIDLPGTNNDRDLAGREFAKAPKWTANAGFTYRNEQGFTFNANANYADGAKTTNNPWANLAESDLGFDPNDDSRVLVNLRTGYEWDKFGVFMQISNLFDEEYIQANSTGYGSLTLGLPRQLSFSAEAHF